MEIKLYEGEYLGIYFLRVSALDKIGKKQISRHMFVYQIDENENIVRLKKKNVGWWPQMAE